MLKGTGLGLRFRYIEALLHEAHDIHWLELLADNFHDLNFPRMKDVECLLERFPCALHSVNLSLASSDPLNEAYVKNLQKIIDRFDPVWISDHLCFSHVGDTFFHDLLPIPFTQKLLDCIAFKIDRLQTRFKKPFLIENISSYLRLKGSEMTEAEFISALCHKTGCGILLDVNNVVVTCHNHGESVQEFYEALPLHHVMQIHMAGATHNNDLMIDTHSQPITDAVLSLYRKVIYDAGPIPTCLEWDADLPEFAVICAEVHKINTVLSHQDLSDQLDNFTQSEFTQESSITIGNIKENGLTPVEQAFLEAFHGEMTSLQALCASSELNQRFAVYESSIISTLQQTLYKIYRPLETLLGVDTFQELCHHYAKANFAKTFNLNRYGEDLASFIHQAPYSRDMPYLPDFIKFCYLWQQTYLQPELGVLKIYSDYPVYEIWQRCQPEFNGDKVIEDWDGPFVYEMTLEGGRVKVRCCT